MIIQFLPFLYIICPIKRASRFCVGKAIRLAIFPVTRRAGRVPF